ncbi:hypothetical protein BU15DRAFT_90430 [Melanogaster broomeanus]|nr:hypothetical protein BU15DRAFT_90430 [Melanogaster broomeanus]
MLQFFSLRAILLGGGLLAYYKREYLGSALAYYTGSSTISACLILAGSLIAVTLALSDAIKPQLKFVWHCFLRPLGATDQRTRLDKFYKGQADVYDATRSRLLRGRNTMLSLSASHIRSIRAKHPSQRLIWVDIGGGTGHNIELMDKHFPVSSFDAVYLIDLCEPLLEDASEFSLPEWSHTDPKGSVSFVTLSYSLSMIPNFYALLDRIDYVLHEETGLLGVVDFYTSGRQPSLHEKAIGGTSKECGWLSRWFWQIWFDFDHVSLSPHRRDYLEYKFGTVKTYNGRNRFIIPFITVLYLAGRSRSCDVSHFCHAFQVEGGNMLGNCSPAAAFTATKEPKDSEIIPSLEIGKPALELAVTHSPWRLPYYEQLVHKEFRTFIYSFTWEDPFEDMRHLDLGPDDSMLVITSAGDNALHYAIAAQPHRTSQGHLLELKLAAVHTLTFEDFFALFGEGRHPSFRHLLDSKISPFLSSIAYQFWHINDRAFSSDFYLGGYSGLALRLAQVIFAIAGALCNATSLAEQEKIWSEKLKPVLLNPVVVALLKSPVFCWNALGVPLNQRKMLLDEGTIYEFVRDTLDPALTGHYTPSSCPAYLTRSGFETLKANNGKATDAFRLHTDSIVNVLHGLSTWSLTRAVIMDHLDWFAPGSKDVEDEVSEFARVLAPGGFVLWRSAARQPWYQEVFRAHGFVVSAISVRKGPEAALDMVNMYASFWKAVKA